MLGRLMRAGLDLLRVGRRMGRAVFERAVMGVWVLLPVLPALGLLCSWLVGVR